MRFPILSENNQLQLNSDQYLLTISNLRGQSPDMGANAMKSTSCTVELSFGYRYGSGYRYAKLNPKSAPLVSINLLKAECLASFDLHLSHVQLNKPIRPIEGASSIKNPKALMSYSQCFAASTANRLSIK